MHPEIFVLGSGNYTSRHVGLEATVFCFLSRKTYKYSPFYCFHVRYIIQIYGETKKPQIKTLIRDLDSFSAIPTFEFGV